jgi:hypothetical protein
MPKEWHNLRMKEKIEKRECIAVDTIGVYLGAGIWELPGYFFENLDMCVVETEEWIRSVGKSRANGRIFASTDNRYYGDPDYECLWLR